MATAQNINTRLSTLRADLETLQKDLRALAADPAGDRGRRGRVPGASPQAIGHFRGAEDRCRGGSRHHRHHAGRSRRRLSGRGDCYRADAVAGRCRSLRGDGRYLRRTRVLLGAPHAAPDPQAPAAEQGGAGQCRTRAEDRVVRGHRQGAALDRHRRRRAGRRSRDFSLQPPQDVGGTGQPSAAFLSQGGKGFSMLGYALLFAILALVAGYLGFFGLAGLAATIAKVLLIVFVILLIVSAFSGALRGRPPVYG